MILPRLPEETVVKFPVERKLVYVVIHWGCPEELVAKYLKAVHERQEMEHPDTPASHKLENAETERSHEKRCRQKLKAELDKFGVDIDSPLVQAEFTRLRAALYS